MDVLLKKYFWVVNLTVVGLCAFFAGRAATHALTTKYLGTDAAKGPSVRRAPQVTPVSKSHGRTGDEILSRNVFCSACSPPETKSDANKSATPSSNDPVKTSLQLELVSTMVCPDDDTWSVGIIRNLAGEDKDPGMYAAGMKLRGSEEVEIAKVVSRRVYLRNVGKLEYVEMDGAAAPASTPSPSPTAPTVDAASGDIDKGVSCSGNNCTVDRALVEKMLANPASLATSARFVPSMKDGKPNGFKLYAIRPNSIFGKIGLQNGDTIKAINGNEMTTPDKALEIYTKLRSASHLGVQVERRGETISLDYTIR